MKEKFFEKKVDYFWEYEYPFRETVLKEIFGNEYETVYSLCGEGIHGLVIRDGKIFDFKLTNAKKAIPSDDAVSRDATQRTVAADFYNEILKYAPAATKSKDKYFCFTIGKYIFKIEITKKVNKPK